LKIKSPEIHKAGDIEFTIVRSGRRSIGISVLHDASVVVRVPFFTPVSAINSIVLKKSAWINKHISTYRSVKRVSPKKSYTDGEVHLFRGDELTLKIIRSATQSARRSDATIEIRVRNSDDKRVVKNQLYRWYRNEAGAVFDEILSRVLTNHKEEGFRPAVVKIRTMKRRWGSCSHSGIITLSTELIKLPDIFIEYVIIHELCHLKHHNHGQGYKGLLTRLCPDWKRIRREMRIYSGQHS
jgi:predicted metal-dependent hydrolase